VIIQHSLFLVRFFIDVNPQILHSVARDCKLTLNNFLGKFNIREGRRKDLTPLISIYVLKICNVASGWQDRLERTRQTFVLMVTMLLLTIY